MNNLTVLTIVVLVIITILIFGVVIFALFVTVKAEQKLIENGIKDQELVKEFESKNKKKKSVLDWVGKGISWALSLALLSFAIVALVYKANGEMFSINNKVSLVIASGSMSECYSDDDVDYKEYLINYAGLEESYIKKTEFQVGDIAKFKKIGEEDELTLYQVYAYKNAKGELITHRYVGIKDDYSDGITRYIFRGDANSINDSGVKREQILYEYNMSKTLAVGSFILFLESGFGMYTVIAAIGIVVVSDIFLFRYEKLVNNRLHQLLGEEAFEDKKKKKQQ